MEMHKLKDHHCQRYQDSSNDSNARDLSSLSSAGKTVATFFPIRPQIIFCTP